MLDYGSNGINGMDDDAGEEEAQNPPFTGRWTATSSYDVYMVDTPKEPNDENKEDPAEEKPHETQPRRSPPPPNPNPSPPPPPPSPNLSEVAAAAATGFLRKTLRFF